MPDVVIHPTKRWISLGYTAVFVLNVAAVFLYNNYLSEAPAWALIFPAVLFVWPITRGIRRRRTKIIIAGDGLRYETGVLSKTTRMIQLSKIQNVEVNQSFLQRVFDVGDLSIETAGETNRLEIGNVDQPQEVADEIIEAAPSKGPKQKGEGE